VPAHASTAGLPRAASLRAPGGGTSGAAAPALPRHTPSIADVEAARAARAPVLLSAPPVVRPGRAEEGTIRCLNEDLFAALAL
jgi:hypothetical protein